ncbi:hypothetical protein J3Q64DRAFT_1828717 [Phycomyces blakesleeanus]|uniref:Uncharacterized protein n=1 Tax=Phycomyces blakesleeanus TaxID=4837 RepID=A0ABR3BGM1_PHYBL
MNIQLLFEDGKGSVIDKYGRPEPMNYTIDEEQFRLETLSSPTQYFAQFPLESENKAEIMQMKKETKASQSVYLPSRTKKPSNLFYLFAKTWLLDVLSWVLTVSHFRKYTTKAEHQGSMEPVLQDNNKSNAESSKTLYLSAKNTKHEMQVHSFFYKSDIIQMCNKLPIEADATILHLDCNIHFHERDTPIQPTDVPGKQSISSSAVDIGPHPHALFTACIPVLLASCPAKAAWRSLLQ